MTTPVRVMLADDHPIIREGIRTILASTRDIQLVGEASNGYELQLHYASYQPHVVLLDLNMHGPSPLAIISHLQAHQPQVAILILSALQTPPYLEDLIDAGISGYVLKDELPDVIIQAIRTVVHGGSWFSQLIVQKLVRLRDVAADLSARERQLLAKIAQGWDNARIAVSCHLAEQTVRNYMSRLYLKLGVCSRAEAIIWAREHGIGNV